MAQAAIEVPVAAVPLVAASVQQLLDDRGAAGASACAETLAFLTAGCMVGNLAEVLQQSNIFSSLPASCKRQCKPNTSKCSLHACCRA
jgi:hypothetical protein